MLEMHKQRESLVQILVTNEQARNIVTNTLYSVCELFSALQSATSTDPPGTPPPFDPNSLSRPMTSSNQHINQPPQTKTNGKPNMLVRPVMFNGIVPAPMMPPKPFITVPSNSTSKKSKKTSSKATKVSTTPSGQSQLLIPTLQPLIPRPPQVPAADASETKGTRPNNRKGKNLEQSTNAVPLVPSMGRIPVKTLNSEVVVPSFMTAPPPLPPGKGTLAAIAPPPVPQVPKKVTTSNIITVNDSTDEVNCSPKTPRAKKRTNTIEKDNAPSSSSEDCSASESNNKMEPNNLSQNDFLNSSFGLEVSMFSPHSLQFLIDNESNDRKRKDRESPSPIKYKMEAVESPFLSVDTPQETGEKSKKRRRIHFNNAHSDNNTIDGSQDSTENITTLEKNGTNNSLLQMSPDSSLWDISLSSVLGTAPNAASPPDNNNNAAQNSGSGFLSISESLDKVSSIVCMNLEATFNKEAQSSAPRQTEKPSPKRKKKKKLAQPNSMQEVESFLSQIKYK